MVHGAGADEAMQGRSVPIMGCEAMFMGMSACPRRDAMPPHITPGALAPACAPWAGRWEACILATDEAAEAGSEDAGAEAPR